VRGVRCGGFVAVHGGVPPSGPLLRGLPVEIVVPCPRICFIGWQRYFRKIPVKISIEICETRICQKIVKNLKFKQST
jgi:hypothetical protein